MERIGTAMRDGGCFFEFTHRRITGEPFPATVLLTRVERHGVAFLEATVRDITAQKEAEEELRERTERFELIVRTIDDVFWMADSPITKMFYISPTYERVWHQTVESLYADARSFLAPLHPDDRERVLADFAAQEAGNPFSHEYRIVWPDGTIRWIWNRGFPLTDASGRASRYVGVAKDITDRKQLKESLARYSAVVARQNRELDAANRMKSEFMASVTHELRTPLNSVLGFAGLLKEEVPGPLNAKQAAFVTDILAGGEHLLALVEGILEMSRLDADGAESEREAVEIEATLDERVAAHRTAAEAHGIGIRLEVAPGIGRVEVAPKALRRMLDALLGNAIRFNHEGGTVTVRAERTDGWLTVAVSDTGIGIAGEDMASLFKPFGQLDAGHTRRHGGLGLGLALARRLAELHGGSIEAASVPGAGSTFTLRLPTGERR